MLEGLQRTRLDSLAERSSCLNQSGEASRHRMDATESKAATWRGCALAGVDRLKPVILITPASLINQPGRDRELILSGIAETVSLIEP